MLWLLAGAIETHIFGFHWENNAAIVAAAVKGGIVGGLTIGLMILLGYRF